MPSKVLFTIFSDIFYDRRVFTVGIFGDSIFLDKFIEFFDNIFGIVPVSDMEIFRG